MKARPILAFEEVSKLYERRAALENLSLALYGREILCLLGPSGCGKTTALMIGAGLMRPSSGHVFLEGREASGRGRFLPPEKRRIGFVFQDYALFPHMTNLENVAFGLKGASAERREAARAELQRLDVAHEAEAYPHDLSGGEKQRVALARALAPAPGIIFMDEPFSSLDKHLRERLREETRALLRKRGTACLFVTHDPEEAMFMGDRILLMRRGRAVQTGKPHELYDAPADPEAARFFGEINLLRAKICEGADGLYAESGVFRAPAPEFRVGAEARMVIRPEAFALCSEGEISGMVFEARILEAQRVGGENRVLFKAEGCAQTLKARVSRRYRLKAGDVAPMRLAPDAALLFPAS